MVELPELTGQELTRYSRHLSLPEMGLEGQRKLKASSVLIIGAGGLGCPAILYLAAAGIGTIGIVDYDQVALSNLHRQVLYTQKEIGQSKVGTACKKAAELNPDIQLVGHNCQLSADNVIEIVKPYDVVIDGSDNFSCRYLINDACVLLGKPNIFGAIHRFEGQVTVFVPGKGPCYRCLFPEPPAEDEIPNCAQAGVLGVLPGIVGTIQAAECIKLLLGKGRSLIGRLLLLDALEMQFRSVNIKRHPACTVCGDNPSIASIAQSGIAILATCVSTPSDELSATELASTLSLGSPIVILDVREQDEFDYSHLQQSIHIPLSDLKKRLSQVPAQESIVVYCRSGVRGRKAVSLLQAAGIMKVQNLKGGLRAWAEQVDPSFSLLESD